jgi:hypothetical protein
MITVKSDIQINRSRSGIPRQPDGSLPNEAERILADVFSYKNKEPLPCVERIPSRDHLGTGCALTVLVFVCPYIDVDM